MIIRRAKTEDADKITELLTQVLMIHHNGRPDYFKPGCQKYTHEQLAGIIADDTRPVFVYDDNGVKGYCFCVIKETRDDNIRCDMKTLYIDDLCVDETARGQGIGEKLYNYAKKYAKETGCYNLTLNVWAGNSSARKFYEKQGLKPLSTTMETLL